MQGEIAGGPTQTIAGLPLQAFHGVLHAIAVQAAQRHPPRQLTQLQGLPLRAEAGVQVFQRQVRSGTGDSSRLQIQRQLQRAPAAAYALGRLHIRGQHGQVHPGHCQLCLPAPIEKTPGV